MLFSTHGTDGFKAGIVLAAGSLSWKCWPAQDPLVFLPTVCPVSTLWSLWSRDHNLFCRCEVLNHIVVLGQDSLASLKLHLLSFQYYC